MSLSHLVFRLFYIFFFIWTIFKNIREKFATVLWIITINTMWKVSKFGFFPGPYLSAFGLNTKRHSVSPRIKSECEKIKTRKIRRRTLFTECHLVNQAIFSGIFHESLSRVDTNNISDFNFNLRQNLRYVFQKHKFAFMRVSS